VSGGAHDLPVASAIVDDRDPGRGRLAAVTPRVHLPRRDRAVFTLGERQGDGG